MQRELISCFLKNGSEWFTIVFSVFVPLIITWSISPLTVVAPKIFITIIFFLISIICFLFRFILSIFDIIENYSCKLPKLKLIQDEIYVFEKSEIFAMQTYVSVYYIDGVVEKFIGYGCAETKISNSGLIQVKIKEFIDKKYTINYLTKNKSKIFLRPSLPVWLCGNIEVKNKLEE